MRYQQVFEAYLFTNANPRSIYITTLQFTGVPTPGPFGAGTTVASMQIDLSTTSESADSLSSVFSENVGPDNVTVFGPGPCASASCGFPGGNTNTPELVVLDRPLRYNPALGNLLMDVRIFDSRGYIDRLHPIANLAYSSPTDGVSRVWATNVTATVANGADSLGLSTVIQLSPIPSLTAQFYPLYAGTQTNIIQIIWPSQPSTFVLQTTDRVWDSTSWHNVPTNQIIEDYPIRGIFFPAASAGSMGYYRLVWPGGY
jgi:hypothetical protein